MIIVIPIALAAACCCACTPNEISVEHHDTWSVVKQTTGPDLGYSYASGLNWKGQIDDKRVRKYACHLR